MTRLRIVPIVFSMSRLDYYLSQFDNNDLRVGHSLHGDLDLVFLDSYDWKCWKGKSVSPITRFLYLYGKYVGRIIATTIYWYMASRVDGKFNVSWVFIYNRVLPVFGTVNKERVLYIENDESIFTEGTPCYKRIWDLTSFIKDLYLGCLGNKSFTTDDRGTLEKVVEMIDRKEMVFVGEYLVC